MALKMQQLTPAASALTPFAAVPASKSWLWDINICNRSSIQAKVRLAVTNGATVTYLEFDTVLDPCSTLERTGRKLPAGGVVSVQADNATVDFTLDYVEE